MLGLGKLGGRELTYSSDLDVVFVYSDEGQAEGGRAVGNFEVLSRLAQRLIHALSSYLDEGRLYEVDTRLRPSGQKGALVSSLAGFRAYHAKEAALWERQALIKARTVAGDRALGAEIERLAEAHVYRDGDGDAAAMAAEIGRLRARMEKEVAQETAHTFNIKTGRGGLVDVEFLAQYLQLVHGPRLPSRAPARHRRRAGGAEPRPDPARRSCAHCSPSRTAFCAASRIGCASSRIARSSRSPIAPTSSSTLARRLGYHGDGGGARAPRRLSRAHRARARALCPLPADGTGRCKALWKSQEVFRWTCDSCYWFRRLASAGCATRAGLRARRGAPARGRSRADRDGGSGRSTSRNRTWGGESGARRGQTVPQVALSDLDAAKSRLEAARDSVDLGTPARDDATLREATRNEDVARQELVAARAKLDYADRLVDLREAKIDEAEASVNAAARRRRA